jgi:ubiquitin-protein ligase
MREDNTFIISRRLQIYISRFGNPGILENHFNLNIDNKNSSIKIKTYIPNVEDRNINLTIKYEKKRDVFYFPDFPLEMSEHINKYANSELILQIQIKLKRDYPFKSPEFALVGMKNKLKYGFDRQIYHFIKYKIKLYNEILKENWNATITIDKNILDFFTKINYFEDLCLD